MNPIFAPSNPILSIAPILAVPKIREAILAASVPIVAVSPRRAGQTFKGPAAKNLADLGFEATSLGVAKYYAPFISGMVIDRSDRSLVRDLENLGLALLVTDTAMDDEAGSLRLASETAQFAWRSRAEPGR